MYAVLLVKDEEFSMLRAAQGALTICPAEPVDEGLACARPLEADPLSAAMLSLDRTCLKLYSSRDACCELPMTPSTRCRSRRQITKH
jgi:hypothetical protein